MSEQSTKEIVVAVDGSDASNQAVKWAANAALKRKQPAELGPAYTVPQFMYADGMVPPQELYNELEGEANDKLDNAQKIVTDFSSEVEVSRLLKESAPIDLLLELGDSAEMIVMGSRGLGGLSGLVMGSVSSAVVSHANCPVVVVRKDNDVNEDTKYGPVVVGVDGSDVSRKAMRVAFREAEAPGPLLCAARCCGAQRIPGGRGPRRPAARRARLHRRSGAHHLRGPGRCAEPHGQGSFRAPGHAR